MQKSVLSRVVLIACLFYGFALRARIVNELGGASVSGVSVGANDVSSTLVVAPQGSTAVPVASALPTESMDNPASYFASFNPATTFAACTLIRDVVRAKRDMDARLLKKLKDVLDVQDSAGAGKTYLGLKANYDKAVADAATKKSAYQAARAKYTSSPGADPSFSALEIAVTHGDSAKMPAFTVLLKKAGLKDEWHKMQDSAREVALQGGPNGACNKAWTNLGAPLQGLFLPYNKKRGDILAMATARLKDLKAPPGTTL